MPLSNLPIGMIPQVTGYSASGPGGVFATEVGGGMPRAALDYDRGVQTLACTFFLNASVYSVWNVFYFRRISKGALKFNMKLDLGFGLQSYAVQMVPDSYNMTPTGGANYVISFSVWVENPAYELTDIEVTAYFDLYDIYGSGTSAFLLALEKYADYDTKVLGLV